MRAFYRGLIFVVSSSPLGMAVFASPGHGKAPVVQGPNTFLDQGWSSSTREAFHYAPQGSELVPYYWFLNLMEPNGTTLLKDNLGRYGVLYDDFTPGVKNRNPDHLPIGFARQEESQTLGGITEKHWLGLTCAACHTGSMIPKEGSNPLKPGRIVIDGAPARIDVAAFLTQLQASIQATNSDPNRLRVFAQKVLKAKDGTSIADIEKRFKAYANDMQGILAQYLPQSSGPGRLDCFGAIINRVCVYDIKSQQPRPATLTAPVDFPFIWYTDRQSQIQWFGELPNKTWVDRLARNAGEVSGVFAQVVVKPKASLSGYPSSLDVLGLGRIDISVSSLTAPKWSDVFPMPDSMAVMRGRDLFKPTCQAGGCHMSLAAKGENTVVGPTPLQGGGYGLPDLDTDPNNTQMIHDTLSLAGILQESPLGAKITPPLPATTLVGYAVAGELIGQKWNVLQAYIDYLIHQLSKSQLDAFRKAKAEVNKETLGNYSLLAKPKGAAGFDPTTAGYESRSLNGMWATAPYLHNGSVPNMVQLLWPEQRTATFYTGSQVYDPDVVGYVSDGTKGGVLFNTMLPGNSNKGHTYGSTLTDAQKWDLLAYLKTL